MSPTLQSFVQGRWQSGAGKPSLLVNPSTEEVVAEASSEGLNFEEALSFARTKGGPALRALSFGQRGEILKTLAQKVSDLREDLIVLGITNAGNTRSDAKFDIDGAAATLMHYAELGLSLGDRKLLADGEGIPLGRSARLYGQHVLMPRRGVAVHINAFNFPAWGMAEKLAVAVLAGMPVVSKPATSTAWMAHRMAQAWVDAGVLPEGAFSFIAGGAGNLVSCLGGQDVLAFTGSGDTAASLRALANVCQSNVHVNVEADSLNVAVLGSDVEEGSETLQLFLTDVVREMTQKTGQKCTAVRRIFVPGDKLPAIRELLVERLRESRVGNPSDSKVTVGPLATAQQLKSVREGIARLTEHGEVAVGGAKAVDGLGSPSGKGFFVSPTLVVNARPEAEHAVNTHEVFGPVATLMPFADVDGLEALVAAGGGGLVASLYSDDVALTQSLVERIAPFHGRITLGSEKIAGQSVPPGTVMPQLLHGGPGRAGGGEELGGQRGMGLYLQRVALQGPRTVVEKITKTGGTPTP
jgi:3,4-dehydroadipyl-CoA semialdehyde dehydrogenase